MAKQPFTRPACDIRNQRPRHAPSIRHLSARAKTPSLPGCQAMPLPAVAAAGGERRLCGFQPLVATPELLAELAEASARLETAQPEEIIAWAARAVRART